MFARPQFPDVSGFAYMLPLLCDPDERLQAAAAEIVAAACADAASLQALVDLDAPAQLSVEFAEPGPLGIRFAWPAVESIEPGSAAALTELRPGLELARVQFERQVVDSEEEVHLGMALPAGWETRYSRTTGETYFVNAVTHESTYDVPRHAVLPPG